MLRVRQRVVAQAVECLREARAAGHEEGQAAEGQPAGDDAGRVGAQHALEAVADTGDAKGMVGVRRHIEAAVRQQVITPITAVVVAAGAGHHVVDRVLGDDAQLAELVWQAVPPRDVGHQGGSDGLRRILVGSAAWADAGIHVVLLEKLG